MSSAAALDASPGRDDRALVVWAKYAVMALFLAPIAFAVVWPLMWRQNSPISSYTWILVWVSACCNVIVIIYHFVVPAHPKFLMLRWRRFCIRIHIFAGTVELISAVVALLAPSESARAIAATLMAIAAMGFHIPSATVQTAIVFGAKSVMWPSYLLCVITHAFCAVNLILHPTSVFWIVNTFLIFNIYAWCRITYYLYDWLHLFSTMKYTIAILTAGVILFPAVIGPLAPLLLGCFVAVFVLLYNWLFIRTPGEYEAFVREKGRDNAISREVAELWDAGGNDQANQKLARQLFDNLDEDKDGSLKKEELQSALGSWGLPDDVISAFVRKHMSAGGLAFERFYAHIWSIGAVRHKAKRAAAAREAVSERDKAQFVFRQLDLDQSNTLSAYELQLLLLEWGLPSHEVKDYFKQCDSDGDGEIPFDDFFHKMRPVWRFIFYEILQAEGQPSRQEHMGRLLAASKGARQTAGARRAVKQQLLSRVRFLENADEKLIEDLAASLVTETFRAGDTIFTEGSVGDRFYLIGGGAVRITAGGQMIADLTTGAYFGEGALITDDPRSAAAAAGQDCTLYSMTRSSFDFLVAKYPVVKADLHAIHKKRQEVAIKRTLQQQMLEQVSFLRTGNQALIDDLAASLAPERFHEGDIVIQEGAPGDRFFLLVNGAVRVSKNGETMIDLGPGACFGERALLSNSPRAATVKTLVDSQLFSLRRESFDAIMAKYPEVRMELASAWGNS